MRKNPWLRRGLIGLVVVGALLGLLYAFVVWEGSSARADAPAWESSIAQWLLHRTVPSEVRNRQSPLGKQPEPSEIAAGQITYQRKCEVCHAHDGGGRTEIAAGQYPRVPDFRNNAVQSQTDGEIFYHIANGIRHTGMPAWTLTERETWQVVAHLRHLPITAAAASSREPQASVSDSTYVGSPACKECHAEIYGRWKDTRMANVVRDPRVHADAIAPDLSKPDPLVTFAKADVALVYGSKWKQRYFKKVGDDYFPFPAQWDFTHKQWRPYFVKAGTDWWSTVYPPDNMKRPTGPLCDGCHSVNYDIKAAKPMEWNVGCERCHGPGSQHVKSPTRSNIMNPARMDHVQGNDVCISCHSQGQPLSNPIAGKYYDWPVGYDVGRKLQDFWKLEEHRPGTETFTHFANGSAHKNRMQGNDYIQSLMYERGVTCYSCHDAHGTSNDGLLRAPGNGVCLSCHGPNTQNGPRSSSIEAHTHHKAGSPGNQCVACHMPRIAQTIGDVNVRAHTFRFITPAQSEALKVPNPCAACHADKSSDWIAAALRSWPERSPWRMAE